MCEATLGGAGRHVLEITEVISASGCEVHFLYSTLRSDKGFLEGLARLRVSHPEIPLHEIDMTRNPGPGDLAALLQIRAYIHRNGPFDVIHSHCTKAGFLARIGASSSRQVYTPNAFLSLSRSLPALARKAVGFCERLLALRTDRIIAVSEEEYRHALELGIPESKLALIPNGVDLNRLFRNDSARRAAHRAELGISDGTICIGFVGRMTYQKHPELLVRVVAGLPQHVRKKVHFAVVGNGELWEESKALAEQLGVSTDISWLGEQSGISWMTAFDLYLMTSRYEGLPYVLVEAMAYGLPTITTAVGGVSLLIEDGKNGFVTPVEQADPLCERIGRLVQSPELRESMKQEQLDRVELFTLGRMVNSTLIQYQPSGGGLPPAHGPSVLSPEFEPGLIAKIKSTTESGKNEAK